MRKKKVEIKIGLADKNLKEKTPANNDLVPNFTFFIFFTDFPLQFVWRGK